MYGLEGCKAIVTGAAHDIGRAIATRLASQGRQVGILDQDAVATGATAAVMAKNGGTARIVAGNVASKADVETGIASLTAELGPVDIPAGHERERLEGDLSRERRRAVPRHARRGARHGRAPLGRHREPHLMDVCSDQAAYITGETLSVTGRLWND